MSEARPRTCGMVMRVIKSIYRYLLYVLAVILTWSVQYLPRIFALFLGRIGGGLCFRLLSRERRRAIQHLNIAFGNDRENYNIARGVFRHLGMNLLECLQMPRMDKDAINSIVKATGIERIDNALARSKGVIILTSHLGNWEYLAAYMMLNGYKVSVVARKIYYPGYNKLLLKLRRSVGVNILWRNGSVRSMVEVLRQNKILGILPDQDTDKANGIFIDFFGIPAYTPTGPVSLALATGASIVPCFIVREGEGHHIFVEEPLELTITKDRAETVRINTERWSDITERYIRRYPEQWVWMHRRWKTKN